MPRKDKKSKLNLNANTKAAKLCRPLTEFLSNASKDGCVNICSESESEDNYISEKNIDVIRNENEAELEIETEPQDPELTYDFISSEVERSGPEEEEGFHDEYWLNNNLQNLSENISTNAQMLKPMRACELHTILLSMYVHQHTFRHALRCALT